MTFDHLYEWLVDGARDAPTGEELMERLASGLREAGVPLDRFALFQPTMNPTTLGRAFYWRLGQPVVAEDMKVATGTLREATSVAGSVLQSPIYEVFRRRVEFRTKLAETAPRPDELPMVRDFRAQGFTDYLVLPLHFRSSETHALSIATKHEGGFTDDMVAALRKLSVPFTRITEVLALEYSTEALLAAYLGSRTADRVLRGKVFRGDVELVRAVIWFSDLRGFTKVSSTREPRAVIDLLNDLFDCQVPAIAKYDGEVLKFIGDGLLAIFPCPNADQTAERCAAALAAARETFAALAKHNAANGDADAGVAAAIPLNVGIALHLGEVAYGNIGGSARLDFTTVGAAVNLAARLEGLASKLGRDLVVSADFAAAAGASSAVGPMTDLGEFELKGIAQVQRVFAI